MLRLWRRIFPRTYGEVPEPIQPGQIARRMLKGETIWLDELYR